ncbi:serine-rich adhesin for platelets [Eurosta solidaginis]|uniref:serine-rich adhesin for platelets n=1 Tax=Eurosta solidaginis TaxID=178769 RepID=UPI0035311DAE
MFRPIKNFINYIQKNASGSAIFGSSTTIADTETEPDAEEVGIEATNINNNNNYVTTEERKPSEGQKKSIGEISISNKINEQTEGKKMKRMQINKVNILNGNKSGKGEPKDGVVCLESDDDIETQIRSSVMVREPIKPVDRDESAEGSADVSTHASIPDRSDIDSQLDDDDYPNISLVSDEGSIGGGEDTAEEEVITEGEDTQETYLDLTSEQEHGFEDNEIIVIGDDVNSSIASDAPSEDPLAIDDLTQPSITSIKDTSLPLDSSTNDEASTSTDFWNNIDHLKKNVITPNLEKDATPTTALSSPHRPLNPSKETNNNASARCSTDEPTLRTQSDEHAEELRSDGSDSGLGSETSTLQITLASVTDTSQLATPSDNSASNTPNTYKRKLEDTSNDYCSGSSSGTSTVTLTDSVVAATSSIASLTNTVAIPSITTVAKPLRSNLKRRLDDDSLTDVAEQTQLANTDGTLIKKLKRSINFDNVQVYYFPRQQGFGCVPSAGGCTLGMGSRHIAFKTLTLAEHAAELRRAHRLQLQEINPRGSSSDDSEESEEDYLSEGSGSDLDAESNGFLQPVSPKQRRALLKAAGVRKIDAGEKIECRNIRNSREVCGCTCVEFCDPETCACSQAGIKCQVDRAMFPCGCTRDACGNIAGRVEFNPTRVRTHFIHTIMRLEMENRQQQNPPLCSTMSSYSLSATCATSSTIVGSAAHASGLTSTPSYANSLPGSYYSMQTQSNYSSGYASPAYTGEPAANYYQQQSSSNGTTTATHFSAVSTTTDLQTSTQQTYQLDSLDAGIYTGSVTATPVYGDMLPSYSSSMEVSATTATVSAYHQNINYASVQQAQISTYTAYQQASSSGYSSQNTQQSVTVASVSTTASPPTTFSSCAVPSLPPYGAATTTAAAALYEDSNSYTLVDTTAPSCITMEDSGGSDVGSDLEGGIVNESEGVTQNSNGNSLGDSDNNGENVSAINNALTNINSSASGNSSCHGFSSGIENANDTESDSSFIQLSTPVSSATRLSQINDLLQHNRHTTATLVSVSHPATLNEENKSTDDKPTCIRSVATDCDYNDSSNSLLNVKEGKILGKAKDVIKTEIVTIEEKVAVVESKERIEKTPNTPFKHLKEVKDVAVTVVNAESNAYCAVTKQKANTDAVTRDFLNATAISAESISAADSETKKSIDSKTNAIIMGTNTTTAAVTSVGASCVVNVDSN